MTAQTIIMALTAPASGKLSDRIGSRIPTTLGMLILAAGLFLVSRLTLDSPFWVVVLSLTVGGSCAIITGGKPNKKRP